MFAGLKTWFVGNKAEIETVATDGVALVEASGVVSPALLVVLQQLGASIEANGVAYTLFHKATLLDNLAVALLGQNHPAVVAHLATVTADVNAVAALTPAPAVSSTVTASPAPVVTSTTSVTSTSGS